MPRLAARPVAGFAGCVLGDVDLLADPERRLLKSDGQVEAQVGSRAAPPLGAAEKITKDIAERGEDVLEAARAAEAAALQAFATELIVDVPFFRVLEGIVGFGSLLEALLRAGIAGVFIRVVF